MILVVGGAFQGKTAYACEKFNIDEKEAVDGNSCDLEELYSAKLIYHFHQYVKRLMLDNIEFSLDELKSKNPELILVTNELGCGIVPMEAFDREYREKTGRICCELAREAREVHRVVCGLGMVLKHE